MKTITTLLFSIITLISYADGGRYSYRSYIQDMEPTFNLFYTSLDGLVSFTNSKGKEKTLEVTANVAIYDIENKKTKYLFPDTLNEKICDFYFESHYDSTLKRMRFNQDKDDYDRTHNIIGNIALAKRACSTNLIITTYSYNTQKYSLWLAHKDGENLRRVKVFSHDIEYLLDVKNRSIRFVKQVGTKIEIEDISY